jgi:hypothetical protein
MKGLHGGVSQERVLFSENQSPKILNKESQKERDH